MAKRSAGGVPTSGTHPLWLAEKMSVRQVMAEFQITRRGWAMVLGEGDVLRVGKHLFHTREEAIVGTRRNLLAYLSRLRHQREVLGGRITRVEAWLSTTGRLTATRGVE